MQCGQPVTNHKDESHDEPRCSNDSGMRDRAGEEQRESSDLGFIDKCQTFCGKPGLIRRDSFHPTWEGAALISRTMTTFISRTD